MVQVDVFWSYGIGAGIAVANARQLDAAHIAGQSAYDQTSFRDAALFLGTLFVPSGAYLIWRFTSWETMHVGTRDLPGWLMAGFTMTNFTQGILGFAVAATLLRRRKQFAAYLQWILGYFGMFFILVHGWDGTGYMRFFSSTPADLAGWTWATAARWLTEDVAVSLYVMGSIIGPVLFGLMARDLKRGYAMGRADAAEVNRLQLALSLVTVLLIGALAPAILASVALRYLGPLLGSLAFAGGAYLLLLRRDGILHRHCRRVMLGEEFVTDAIPADTAARA